MNRKRSTLFIIWVSERNFQWKICTPINGIREEETGEETETEKMESAKEIKLKSKRDQEKVKKKKQTRKRRRKYKKERKIVEHKNDGG